jgi:hypothetical protein
MSRRLWVIASAVVVAICVAPFAIAAGEGQPVRGGARNPSNNASQAYARETQIIANNSTYGTRQSNKSNNGGGAIYGCRSGEGGTAKGNKPCLRASNLAKGYAFEYNSGGTQGGLISVGNGGDNTKPFTTNATGVADGLNADRVDGKNASDIVADAQAQNPFAQVSQGGALGAQRGVASASHESTGSYAVVFANDVSKCAYNATVVEDGTDQGFASVQAVDAKTLRVRVHSATSGNPLADRGFHITATC